ncbi:MAG: cupredoxin domain-containing protein [Dehalococcoidia bacterium]
MAGALVAAAACITSTSPTNGGGSTPNVQIRDNFFSPKVDTVAVGTTVSWTWANPVNPHNVVWDSGPILPPNSGAPSTAGSYSFKFNQAGTYDYHCEVHVGLGMVGTIVGT